MFDGIQSNLGPCESNIVGILPGSRDEVVGNIQQVLCVIEQLELLKERRFIMALSPNVTYEKLHQAVQSCAWTIDRQGEGYVFQYTRRKVFVEVSYSFMDVLHQSSMVIGLAGTANEQAMFAKRPLISFIGTGPQSTKQRFVEQHQLIDGATTYLINSKDSHEISKQISTILNDHDVKWQALPNVQDVASQIIDVCLI